MRNVTIKTIAADLGVTAAAVSVALHPSKRGTSKVSAATAERICAYAKKLNYRPSLASKAMHTQQLRQVGVVVESEFSVDRRPPVVAMPAIFGLNDFLSTQGWHLNILNDKGERGGDVRLPRYLQEDGLDGVVVCSSSKRRDEAIALDLKRFSIPSVFLNAVQEHNSVTLDDRAGAALATRHLIDLGHSEIIYMGGSTPHDSLMERLASYRQVMEEKGLAASAYFFKESLFKANEGYQNRIASYYEAGRWFVDEIYAKHRPTAVFCYDDGVALIVMRGLHAAGISVPGEVSVVGYNDIPFVDMLPTALTTVRSDFYAMGWRAGEMLLEMIGKEHPNIPSSVVKPELIVRESSGPVPGSRSAKTS